jgi:hypothetical protein
MANSNPVTSSAKTVRFDVFEDKANPFIGMNVMGFEPPEVTIEKVLKKRRKKAGAAGAAVAAAEAPTEADEAAVNKSADYAPLQPGENLFGGHLSHARLHNIVGGWA